jgi:hypothetical protein
LARADVEHLADRGDGALPAGWESTVDIGLPERRQAIHIRLDPEVLRWFKARGPGYRTRINAVLGASVEARQLMPATRRMMEWHACTTSFRKSRKSRAAVIR